MKKLPILVFIVIFMLGLSVSIVMADGATTREICTTSQYGETTCTTTTENPEVIVHEPIDAAIGDNPLLLATILFGGGYIAYKASRKIEAQ